MTKDLIYPDFNTSLEEVLREGAQKMLQSAIENEVKEFLEKFSSKKGVKHARPVIASIKITGKYKKYLPVLNVDTWSTLMW